MKAIIRFYKVSFLVGFHVAAAVWAFMAVKLALAGQSGPAVTFGVLSGITTAILAGWWIARSEN